MTPKKFTFLNLLLSVMVAHPALAKIEKVIGLPLEKNANLAGFVPQTDMPEVVISRSQYVISYNKQRRAPNWSAWKIEKRNIGKAGRRASFSTDTDLEEYFKIHDPSYHAVAPSEYTDTCFDRGHQVPSADRSDTDKDNAETFLMSNMAPQTPYLNRVIWAHLEIHTRDLILSQHKKAYVVDGPLYENEIGNMGPERDIKVPSAFFKVIYLLDSNQTEKDINAQTPVISVIMPNVDIDGSQPHIGTGSKDCKAFESHNEDMNDWKKFQVSVSEIEKRAGIKLTK